MKSFLVRGLRAANHASIKLLSYLEFSSSSTPAGPSNMSKQARSAEESAVILTTFSNRFFSHAIPTLESFREANLDRKVFLVINGDQGKDFDQETRSQFLSEALSIYPVSPICFGSGRGMAEMWNAGARFADLDKLIFLNEDLMIDPSGLVEAISLMEEALKDKDLVILNQSFGHFGVTRPSLMDLGWFDERFLGFGEEDGDFVWRFVTSPKYGEKGISHLSHPAINNISSKIGYESITSRAASKYSSFNFEMLRLKYRFTEGPAQGTFGTSAELISAGPEPYPQEAFRKSAQQFLTEDNANALRDGLRTVMDGEGQDKAR